MLFKIIKNLSNSVKIAAPKTANKIPGMSATNLEVVWRMSFGKTCLVFLVEIDLIT